MKVSLIIILLLVSVSGLFGQDGSDIMYWKASAIDNALAAPSESPASGTLMPTSRNILIGEFELATKPFYIFVF